MGIMPMLVWKMLAWNIFSMMTGINSGIESGLYQHVTLSLICNHLSYMEYSAEFGIACHACPLVNYLFEYGFGSWSIALDI